MKRSITTSIIPFLVVDNGVRALEFYQAAFNATIIEKFVGPTGKINAKIAIDKAEMFVGDEEAEFNNLGPKKIGGSPVRIVLIVGDPDTTFRRAISAGATEVCPVTAEESWKIGKLTDPFGHTWEIGHPLE